MLLNRLQDKYALVLIPLNLFGSRNNQNGAQIVTLLQEQSEIWFNVSEDFGTGVVFHICCNLSNVAEIMLLPLPFI